MNQGSPAEIDPLWKHLGLDKRDTSYILIFLFPPALRALGGGAPGVRRRETEAEASRECKAAGDP